MLFKSGTIIDLEFAMAFGKERFQTRQLGISQPVKIAHRSGRFVG